MSSETQEPTGSSMAARRWQIELGTLIFLGLGVLVLLREAFSLRWEARLFPVVILVLTVGLIAAQIVVVVTRYRRSNGEVGLQAGFDIDLFDPVALRRTGKLMGWIALLMLLIWAFGVTIAASAGTAAYLRFDGKETWRLSLMLGSISLAYLSAVLVFGLGLPLMGGVIGSL